MERIRDIYDFIVVAVTGIQTLERVTPEEPEEDMNDIGYIH